MTDKINVALVYGGPSVEHDVSVISARNIQDNIDPEKFSLHRFGIDKSGRWLLMTEVDKDFSNGHEINLNLNAANPYFLDLEENQKINIDLAFVILHGTDGEDGTIQGLFKMMNIPVVGSDVMGSSVAMNKMVSKKLLIHEGIPTAACIFMNKNETQPSYSDITEKLGSPFIVKPANLGSSVGVSKVNDLSEYDQAIIDAFKYDTNILIEEFVDGRELECAILGNNPPVASPAGEVELKKDYEFYSFDAKYVDGESSILHIPADISNDTQRTIKDICVKAFQALGCNDFARVDLFLKPDGNILINEINTLPGFTNISMYPKLCELMDIPYTELISRLIELALERNEERKKLETEYISGIS